MKIVTTRSASHHHSRSLAILGSHFPSLRLTPARFPTPAAAAENRFGTFALLGIVVSLVMGVAFAAAQSSRPTAEVQYVGDHGSSLHDVAFSRDGRLILVAGHDGQLHLWDRQTGEAITSIRTGKSPLLSLALAGDAEDVVLGNRGGDLIYLRLPHPYPRAEWGALANDVSTFEALGDDRWLSSHPQQGIQLWKPKTGSEQSLELQGKFEGLTAPLAAFAYEQTVLAANADGNVQQWNRADRSTIQRWRVPPLRSVAKLGVGKLALGGADGRLRILDATGSQPTGALATHSESVTAVTVSKDGRWLLSSSADQKVYLFDRGELRWKFDPNSLTSASSQSEGRMLGVGFVPGSALVFAHNDQGQVWLLKREDASLVAALRGAAGAMDRVAVDAKGRVLAGGRGGRVQVWQVPPLNPAPSAASQRQTLPHAAAVTSLTRAGQRVVAGTAEGKIQIWEDSKKSALLAAHSGPVTQVAISPTTERLASSDATAIHVRAAATDDEAPQVKLTAADSELTGLAFRGSPEQLVGSYRNGLVRQWALDRTGPEAALAQVQEPLEAMALAADRQALLLSTEGGRLQGFSTEGGKQFLSISKQSASPIRSIQMHRESGKIITAHADGRIRVWSADGSLLASLGAHRAPIYDVAIHPSGDRMATGGANGQLKIWKYLAPTIYEQGLHPIADFAVHPNATVAVTFGADGAAVARSLPTGELLWTTVAAEVAPLTAGCFRFDGQWLALGDQTGALQLRNSADGELLGSVEAHPGPVRALAFSRQHQHVATADEEGLVKIWKVPLETGARLARVPVPDDDSLENARFSSQGSRLIGWTNDRAYTVTLSDGKVTEAAIQPSSEGQAEPDDEPGFGTTAATWSSDQTVWARGTRDGRVEFYNGSNALAGEIGAHAAPTTAIALHPESDALATADAQGEIRLWLRPEPPKTIAGPSGAVTQLASDPTGKTFWATAADKSLRQFGWPAGNAAQTATASEPITHLAASPSEPQLATGDAHGNLTVWNTADAKSLSQRLAHPQQITGICYGSDKIVTAGEEGCIKVWPATAPAPQVLTGPTATSRAVAQAGKVLVTTGDDGHLRIFERESGKLTQSIAVPGGAVRSVAISRDATRVAAGSANGAVRAWLLAESKLLLESTAHQGAVSALHFGPAANQLISGGEDAGLCLWSVPGEKSSEEVMPEQRIDTPHEHLNALAVHDQAETIYSAGDDGTIRRWKLADLSAVDVFQRHDSSVTDLSLAAKGSHLCSGSKDQTVKVWQTADKKLQASWKLDDAVQAVSIAADGQTVATAVGNRVTIYRVVDQMMQEAFALDHPALALLLDAESATPRVCSAGDRVQWQTTSCEAFWRASDGPVTGLAAVANSQIISSDGTSTLTVWNLEGAVARQLEGQEAGFQTLCSDPEGKLVVAADLEQRLFAWDPIEGSRLWQTHAGTPVQSVAVARDRSRIAVAGARRVQLRDSADGTLLQSLTLPAAARDVAFPGEANAIAVALENNQIWTTAVAFQKRLEGPQAAVRRLIYSPSGDRLLSCSDDHQLTLFDATSGAKIRNLDGATQAVQDAEFSSDGSQIVACGKEPVVRLWNASDGKLLSEFQHPESVIAVSLSSDATRFASACADGILRVWDVESGLVWQQFSSDSPLRDVQFEPGGMALFMVEASGEIHKQPLSVQAVFSAHQGAVRSLTFNSAGDQLVTSGEDQTVKLWKVDGEAVRTLTAPEAEIVDLDLHPKEAKVAGAATDGQVYIWRLDNGAIETKVLVGGPLRSVDYSADGNSFVASDEAESFVYRTAPVEFVESHLGTDMHFRGSLPELLGRAGEQSLVHQPLAFERSLSGHQGTVLSQFFTPDGNHLISAGEDRSVRMWNVSDGSSVRTFSGHADAVVECLAIPGTTHLLSASRDGSIRRWNWPDGKPVHEFELGQSVRDIAVSSDGSRLAAAGTDVLLWELKANRLLQNLIPSEQPTHLAFLDNSTLAVADKTGQVTRHTIACERVWAADEEQVADLAMARHGNEFVTSGSDKLVKMWSADGTLVRNLSGAAFVAQQVRFSPDDQYVAAGGDEQFKQPEVYLWSAADGQLRNTLTMPAPVKSLEFLADEEVLVVACIDQTLRFHSVPDGRLLEQMATEAVIQSMVGSADGNAIWCTAGDRDVHIRPRRLQSEFPAHTAAITGLRLSEDGQSLFTASADQAIVQWRISDWKKQATFAGLDGPITALDLSESGRMLVAASAKRAAVWKFPKTATPHASHAAQLEIEHAANVSAIDINADGTRLALGDDAKTIAVWDLVHGMLLQSFDGHESAVTCVAVDQTDGSVFSGGADKTVRHWNVQVEGSWGQLDTPLTALATCSGSTLFAAAENGEFGCWNLQNLAARSKETPDFAPAPTQIVHPVVTPDNAWLLAAGTGDASAMLLLWNVRSGALAARHKLPAAIAHLYAIDNNHFLVAGEDQVLRIYRFAQTPEQTPEDEADEQRMSLVLEGTLRGHTGTLAAIAPENTGYGFTMVSSDRTVRRWSVPSTAQKTISQAHRGPVYAVALTPDGRVVSGGADGTVRIGPLQNDNRGSPDHPSPDHPSPDHPSPDSKRQPVRKLRYGRAVLDIALHAETDRLYVVGNRAEILVWSLKGGVVDRLDRSRLEANPLFSGSFSSGRTSAWRTLAVSRDGTRLAAADLSTAWFTWRLRENTNGGPRQTSSARAVAGHNAPVTGIEYDPSGKRVATVDRTGHVTIWDALLATPLVELQLPFAGRSLAWNQDGTELAVVGRDPRIARILLQEGMTP